MLNAFARFLLVSTSLSPLFGAVAGDWLTGAYVLAIIFLVIAHAGAFHFNPVMGLLGYHFYAVKNGDGVSHLLISRIELRRPGRDVTTVRLAHGIYLHTGGTDD
ncbi:hypothetical protein ABC977_02025 [Thioalkalicoccus limnaeus]|uniref:Uncharacterized protein n=1 Tax=Thioalkalicoccus limnaeus TaxID=120681 RepID=A0ABV4B9W3_9GAMM